MFIGRKNITVSAVTQHGYQTVMIQVTYLKGTPEEGFQAPEVWDAWTTPQVRERFDAIELARFIAMAIEQLVKFTKTPSIDVHQWEEVKYG